MATDLLQRGVYRMPFLTAAGEFIAVAVDDAGREVARLTYASPGFEKSATGSLWDALDAVNAIATYGPRLVKEEA